MYERLGIDMNDDAADEPATGSATPTQMKASPAPSTDDDAPATTKGTLDMREYVDNASSGGAGFSRGRLVIAVACMS